MGGREGQMCEYIKQVGSFEVDYRQNVVENEIGIR